jgi:hypothetical protein
MKITQTVSFFFKIVFFIFNIFSKYSNYLKTMLIVYFIRFGLFLKFKQSHKNQQNLFRIQHSVTSLYA